MFQFGATNNNAQSGGSLGGTTTFGSQPATGGLFGSNAAKPAFGASNTTGMNTASTGGLFGNNNPTTNQTAAPSGGLFGNNTQSNTLGGGLFGNNTNNNNTSAPTNGLFGNNNNAQTAGTNTLGSTGGLFGARTQLGSTNAPTTGGLFGNNNNTQQNPSTLGGGLFGNRPQGMNTGAAGGLFGNNQGQQQQQQQQAQQTGFGIKSTQPSFAWSQQAQPQQLQQNQSQFQTNPMLGSLNLQTPSSLTLQQQQSANYPQQIQEQIIKCKESWDPLSSKSKLRTFVYNKVNEQEALLYSKPANILQEEWDQAVRNKPNNDVIPVELLGFEALNQRNLLQIENVAQIRIILKQLLEKNTQLQQRHEIEIASRILKVTSKNVEIESRLLKLGSQLALLKNRGLPLNVTEEKMWNQFKVLLNRSQDPSGLGKTNELWARLAVLKERARNISDQLDNTLVTINQNGGSTTSTNDSSKTGAASLNRQNGEEPANDMNIDKIAHILASQQKGITYLQEVLDKDQAVVDKLEKGK
ncbi:similar to Saccharomyces cerevisiae YGR119C NUP57 Nucleoporin [Maudiozyma saulgeensis]|uniref:Similar to Saccharomyces cerevisiae YGR119C NUP57 Nucleoporin n=1 Tax=Maudiozyma saulgeensis TaxID=1789683 RepID=A0A1X7RA43_9SACH|nr:similar to Saccharomyces cerevisiae YGR119C NUP57 Nucleoporin [Kazachstania saulgeensis]